MYGRAIVAWVRGPRLILEFDPSPASRCVISAPFAERVKKVDIWNPPEGQSISIPLESGLFIRVKVKCTGKSAARKVVAKAQEIWELTSGEKEPRKADDFDPVALHWVEHEEREINLAPGDEELVDVAFTRGGGTVPKGNHGKDDLEVRNRLIIYAYNILHCRGTNLVRDRKERDEHVWLKVVVRAENASPQVLWLRLTEELTAAERRKCDDADIKIKVCEDTPPI